MMMLWHRNVSSTVIVRSKSFPPVSLLLTHDQCLRTCILKKTINVYFTLTAQAICRQQCQPCISALIGKRNASMARECERLSSAPLPPLFSLPRVGWELKLRRTFYRRLAGQLSIRKNMPFHLTMKWLRTQLSVILLRSSLLCLRGSRSLRRRRLNLTRVHPEVVCFDSRLV